MSVSASTATVYDDVADALSETCRCCFEPIWFGPVGMAVGWVSEGNQAICPFSVTGRHDPAEVD